MADERLSEGTPPVLPTPPAGLDAPERGFGRPWARNANVRARLGRAIEPEQGETGGCRRFQRGFLLHRPLTNMVSIVNDSGVGLRTENRY